jgi:hypothetical protein
MLALAAWAALAAVDGGSACERRVVRTGERIELWLNSTQCVRLCHEGASPLRLWLLWHRSELRLDSETPESRFDFGAGDRAIPFALAEGLLGAAFHAPSVPPSLSRAEHFSPFGAGCVRVRLTSQWIGGSPFSWASREDSAGVLVHVRANQRVVWWLPLVLACGCALMWHAGAWCERDGVYYAGGVSGGLAFGLLLVAFYAIHLALTGRWPRALASFVAVTGYIGSLAGAVSGSASALLVRHARVALAYAAACGSVGLVLVHRSLSARGGVPLWGRDCMRWALRLLGGALVVSSSYSTGLAAACGLLAALVGATLAAIPEAARDAVWSALFEQPPAPKPATTFLASGVFLTHEQYEIQGQIETDRALEELHATPAFQRWLRSNHSRLSVTQHGH